MRAPELPRRAETGLVLVYLAAASGLALVAADRTQIGLFFASATIMASAALVLYRRNALSAGQIIALGVAARLLVFWLPPGLSDDAFRYLWDGYVQHGGLNPYAATPAALEGLHDTTLYGLLNSPAYFSVYPPLSQVFFWLSTWGDPAEWRTAWYVWKGFCFAAEVGTLLLLRNAGTRGLLLYALHPLPVVEMVGQAHTEALMVFGLALACRAAARRQTLTAGLGWAVATTTKLFPVLLAPFLIQRRRDAWRLLPALAAALVLALTYWHTLAYAGHVLDSLRLYTQYFEFNAGLYYLLKYLGWLATGADFSKQIGPLLALVFAGVYGELLARHWRRRIPFARAAYTVLAAFLLLSTTVHPWYLAGVLVVLPFTRRPGWHWQVLALFSLATYARYTGGPYAFAVAAGWIAWLLFLLVSSRARFVSMLQPLMASRGCQKAHRLAPFVPPGAATLLDLGGAEGYVGAALQASTGVAATVADVVSARTLLPFVLLEEGRLPFEDAAFDVCVLSYVLHHASDPEALLTEAARVTRRRVLILESVYRSPAGRVQLRLLDRAANRLRSGGASIGQEEHLNHRTFEAWQEILVRYGKITHCRRFGRWPHHQALFVLDLPAARPRSTC